MKLRQFKSVVVLRPVMKGCCKFYKPPDVTVFVWCPEASNLFFSTNRKKVPKFHHRLRPPSNTHQTGNDEVADDDSGHRPPALLLAGVKEDNPPEHVKQDDGHSHEGWERNSVTCWILETLTNLFLIKFTLLLPPLFVNSPFDNPEERGGNNFTN